MNIQFDRVWARCARARRHSCLLAAPAVRDAEITIESRLVFVRSRYQHGIYYDNIIQKFCKRREIPVNDTFNLLKYTFFDAFFQKICFKDDKALKIFEIRSILRQRTVTSNGPSVTYFTRVWWDIMTQLDLLPWIFFFLCRS